MVSDRVGGVVAGIFLHLGKLPVILPVNLRVEKPPLVLEVVGAVEAGGDRHSIQVPLARVVGAVAGGLEQGGQELRPLRPLPTSPAANPLRQARNRIPANLLGEVPRQDLRPRRPATRGVIELLKTQAITRQAVEVGGLDLSSVAAEIGEAEIVGHDQENIGAGWGGLFSSKAGCKDRQHQQREKEETGCPVAWFHFDLCSSERADTAQLAGWA